MQKKTNWIQTYSGIKFYPLEPDLDKITIIDIAHALSLLCRYNGHCSKFYSIAQHSVIISKLCSEENALCGLLHDAAEAYISDIPRPVKHRLLGFEEIENNLLSVIFERFNVSGTITDEIKELDARICLNEGQALMKDTSDWVLAKDFDPIDNLIIESVDWYIAKNMFLNRFYELATSCLFSNDKRCNYISL